MERRAAVTKAKAINECVLDETTLGQAHRLNSNGDLIEAGADVVKQIDQIMHLVSRG